MEYIFIIHLFTTLFMTGLCWFVQVVHYPLFLKINLSDFPAYQKANFRTGYVAIPVMFIEMITGLMLLYNHFDFIFILNAILLLLIGLSTFLLQVPFHLRLLINPNHQLMRRLILSNWIRTSSWTVRSAILLYLAVSGL